MSFFCPLGKGEIKGYLVQLIRIDGQVFLVIRICATV